MPWDEVTVSEKSGSPDLLPPDPARSPISEGMCERVGTGGVCLRLQGEDPPKAMGSHFGVFP